MKLTDLISQGIQSANQLKTAILSVREYCDKKLDDLRDYLNSADQVVSLPLEQGDQSIVVSVPRATFENLATSDTVDVIVDKSGTTISVDAQKVKDAFEDMTTNLTATSQAISSAFSGTLEKSTDFIDRVKNRMGEVSTAVLDKYAYIIDHASNPFDIVKAIVSQTAVTVSVDTQGLTIVSGSDYTGDTCLLALTMVTDKLHDIFSDVFNGVRTFTQFLNAALNGVLRFGKWLFHKAFHGLSTVYESAGNYPVGIFDVPVLQLYGPALTAELISQMFAASTSGGEAYLSSWDGYARGYNFAAFNSSAVGQNVGKAISKLTSILSGRDASTGPTVVELILPESNLYESNIGWALRVGTGSSPSHQDATWALQLFPVWKGGSIDANTDAQIYDEMRDTLGDALWTLRKIVPFIPGLQNVDDTSVMYSEVLDAVLPSTVTEGNWAGRTPLADVYLNNNADLAASGISNIGWAIMLGLLMYATAFSHVLPATSLGAAEPTRKVVLLNQISIPVLQGSEGFVSTPELDVTESWALGLYVPFTTMDVLPVAVHYQTSIQQANEILSTVCGILITAVAIYASVKIAKKVGKFKRNLFLKEMQMRSDANAWVSNPTEENYALYAKSRKRYLWNNAFGRLLGMTTTAQTTTQVIPDLIVNITDAITGGKGENLNSIAKLITG